MIRNHHVSVVELSKGVSVGMAGGFVLWVCQFLKFSKNSKFIKITLYVTCLNGGYDKCVSRGGSGCVNLKKINQKIKPSQKSQSRIVCQMSYWWVCQLCVNFLLETQKSQKSQKCVTWQHREALSCLVFIYFLFCMFVGGCVSVGVSMCVSS